MDGLAGKFAREGASKYAYGTPVRIKDLKSKPLLNGRIGKVVKYVKDTGRYGVAVQKLDASSSDVDSCEEFALKEANFEIAVEEAVASEDEDAEDCETSDDGSLDEGKRDKYERRRKERMASSPFANSNIQVVGREEALGLSLENPVYKYPKTGIRPVLIVGGLGLADDDDGGGFLLRAFLRESPEKWMEWGVRFLNFHHGRSLNAAAKIKDALSSGSYRTMVFGDISCAFDKFNSLLANAVKWFVEDFGGSVAFVSSEGGCLVSEVLLKMFPCLAWRPGDYYRATHAGVQANGINLERIFPGAADWKYSVKTVMLDNVPIEERYFATSQEARLFRQMNNDYDPEKDLDENRTATAVAVKQFPKRSGGQISQLESQSSIPPESISSYLQTGHGGKIAYFGDVNGEFETARLIVKFLDSEGASTAQYE